MFKEENKLVFDYKLTNIINAISLLFTYIFMGLIIIVDNNFFGRATRAIEIGFVVIGIIGFIFEVRRLNKQFDIKGFDNILLSGLLFPMFLLLKCSVSVKGCNQFIVFIYQILVFIILALMMFLFCKGVNKIIYSLYFHRKEKKLEFIISSIIVLIAQIFALGLICLHIFQIAYR